MTVSQNQQDLLSLQDVFQAMMALDGAVPFLLAKDQWRAEITDEQGRKADALENFDADLAAEVARQPKSKGGHWGNPQEWNIWTAVHNGLLLPVLMRVLGIYSKANITLSYDEAAQFFSPLPYVIRHAREYQELEAEYHYEGKDEAQVKQEWNDRLESYFKSVGSNPSLPRLLANLPDNLRAKVNLALKHHNEPKAENDSLVGRMICAYLATAGVPWEELGMDMRTEEYLKPLPTAPAGYAAPSLYARLLDVHVHSVPQFMKDLPVMDYNVHSQIPFADFAKMYRWYGNEKVVEMVKPGLIGAGPLGVAELSALFRHMEIKHGLKDHENIVMTESAALFRDTQSLVKTGRLSLVMDIISEGEPLRKLARLLWSDEDRQAAWGNPGRYVPESRSSLRDFSAFRQDIGDIIYSAAVFEERNGHPQRAAGLKSLALATKKSDSLESLGDIIRHDASIINDWAAHWEQRHADKERLKAARFVQETFGLVTAGPVPVTLDEISLGFEGSGYDAARHTYHVKYREAKDTLETDIPAQAPSKAAVIYDAGVLEVKSGNGMLVKIPVPGRGGYDPFGTTGSAHAGEILGFGCSVHHASLSVMLAELAALGAGRAALQDLADKFMEINPGKHHRKMLTDFQVAQTWAAFHEGKTLSPADYLEKNPVNDVGHEHTAAYLGNPDKEPLAAAATRARLRYGYGDLYPADATGIDTRKSWYVTDVDAQLAGLGKPVSWQAVQPA